MVGESGEVGDVVTDDGWGSWEVRLLYSNRRQLGFGKVNEDMSNPGISEGRTNSGSSL